MFAGLTKSMGAEPEKPTFNLGATGQKFNQAATKLANGEIPTFTEESAFAKCCPNLTFRQVSLHSNFKIYFVIISFLLASLLMKTFLDSSIESLRLRWLCCFWMGLIVNGKLLLNEGCIRKSI